MLAHGKSEPGATAAELDPGGTGGRRRRRRPRWGGAGSGPPFAPGPPGTVALAAPLQGTIVSFDVVEGDLVHVGQQVLVMEAMKMEHVVPATASGLVRVLAVQPGDTVFEGHALVWIEEREVDVEGSGAEEEIDLDAIRPDLAEVLARQALTLDAQRPDAVERRRRTSQRTARENVDDLCDAGSYVEYGSLVVAAQRRRRTLDDLIQRTQADGMLAGIGRVNGDLFDDDRAQCVVMSYDYTVLAGTQGTLNHLKKDRMFELAQRWRLPVVFFTEGGGGRPGDTDGRGAGLDCLAFAYWGELSGLVPLVGINSGRCFAGNAALLGCCDVIIATENSSIGMGGPAMIEGGGLGVFRPEEVGPMSVQVPNGVVDVAVADEAEAVAVAKRYLSYFQGPLTELVLRRPAAAAAGDPREPAAQLRHPLGDRHAGRHRLGAGAAPDVRHRHGHRARAGGGAAARRHRQQPDAPGRAPSTPTGPTRRPASCSSATPSTSRCCSCRTRPG